MAQGAVGLLGEGSREALPSPGSRIETHQLCLMTLAFSSCCAGCGGVGVGVGVGAAGVGVGAGVVAGRQRAVLLRVARPPGSVGTLAADFAAAGGGGTGAAEGAEAWAWPWAQACIGCGLRSIISLAPPPPYTGLPTCVTEVRKRMATW